MLGIASGAVLVPLNSTMLAVALPSVMETFGVDAATVASLVTLYLAAVAIALPASGSLGDRFGHRRAFLIGVVGFAAASVLAASTTSFAILASARVLQAVTGALVSTSSTALVRAEAPPSRQGAAFGLFDMLVSIAAAIGPLVGGLVVVAVGWRGLFLLAVPVAAIAVATVGLLARPRPVEAGATTTPRPVDLSGLALLAITLVAALLAIRGPLDGGLGSAAAVAVIPLAIVFVAVELRADHPAVDPRLLGSRPFAAALFGVFGMTVVLHGCFLVVPLLVERLQSGSPTTAGLVLLGISALWGFVAPLGGRLSDRVGRRRPAVVGGMATAIGLAVLWQVAPSVSTVVLGGLLALVGLGMGLSGSPRQAAAMEVVGADRLGMAAGTYYTGRYLGGVVGASLAGAVLGSSVTAEGVMTVFGLLAIAAVAVTVASVGLPTARSTTRTSR
ncbi:MAG TPA: MFS transporter [Candidatus Limnocylindrales bacterium]|jgi:DHA2 family methylenomycin A resistance protein-like MFS transporter|nr:MFS transporter [Candidatus Limnocylindrales bacterium]